MHEKTANFKWSISPLKNQNCIESPEIDNGVQALVKNEAAKQATVMFTVLPREGSVLDFCVQLNGWVTITEFISKLLKCIELLPQGRQIDFNLFTRA